MEETIVRDYLLNLLFIFLSLFIFQLWIQKKKVHTKKELSTGIFLFSALGVFLCTSFPVHLNEDYIYDLRDVSLWIGGLYGGPHVSGLLFLFNVFYRSLFGGWGIVSTIIGGGFIAIVSGYFSSRFILLSQKQKLWFVMGASASSTLIIFIMAWVHMGFMISPYLWLEGFVIQVISAGIITFSAETVRNHLNLQEYMVHNDKWESVSQLSASFSHEIRNKVTASKGFLQFLKEMEKEKNKLDYYDIAIKELNETEKIIHDYLTFAKPNPNRIELLNLEEEIKYMTNMIQPLSKMKSVTVEMFTQGYHIQGERSLFRQALLNIMKNALEAMPEGGNLQINISNEDNDVCLEITDTGVGMTKDQIKRLGEPYFTTKGSQGTGLGMMVVYRVIEGMEGSIKVQSQIGEGTSFIIRFPIADTV